MDKERDRLLAVDRFKGADFASDPMNVDLTRSPDMLNMLPDADLKPVSRTGYRCEAQFGQRINGVHFLKTESAFCCLVHAGNRLYRWFGEGKNPDRELISECMNDFRSTAFQMDGKLWMLDGLTYRVFMPEGESFALKAVEEMAYVPTTVIARAPGGGGQTFEYVNLLQSKRKNSFLGTAGTTIYRLDAEGLDLAPVTVEKLGANGSFTVIPENQYSVNRTEGTITFTTAPGASPVTGRDNLIVTFSKTVTGYAERINGCTIAVIYGIGSSGDTVFMSGNDRFPNTDWYSFTGNPSYMPDLHYSNIGQSNTRIMGYSKLGDGRLAIHKERNYQDSTVFFRRGELINGQPQYFIQEGATGIGAVSRYAFAMLENDPLALSGEGVFATVPVQNSLTNEKYAVIRSALITPRLVREPNLEEASAIVYRGFYYLCAGEHVYVADARQKSLSDNVTGQYQYEWYYLDNIDARVWFEQDGELMFGTRSGKLCRFYKEQTPGGYQDEGRPIRAYWRTPILSFGTMTRYKTLKNLFVTLNPYIRSTVTLSYIVKGMKRDKRTVGLNTFAFEDIDFADFTFETDTFPRIRSTNIKERRFEFIQFEISTNRGQPFGLFALSAVYSITGCIR